ncbi:MAG: N-acetyltransferase DgcN [Pseudomonadota bacterium]
MEIQRPYLLFLGDVPDALAAKTALGIVDWRREWCVGQMRLPGCMADTGLPDMLLGEASEAGARTMIIGAVNAGGVLPANWIESIVAALEAGMDVASGLHTKLSSIPEIAAAASKSGRSLFDVRHTHETFATGKGVKRTGKRLLTVGTDCSVGKKYAALALEKGMRDRGYDADFKATGQTGVFISGRGASIDAVIADFISGAVEWLTPDAAENHWDLVEGQGSICHPSFAGVSLGLLHGAQPDAFVVCHEPTRKTMRGVATPIPDISEIIDLTLRCGRLTNPAIRCVGLAVNTSALDGEAAVATLDALTERYEVPATDPIRFGVDPIVDQIDRDFPR